MKSISNLLSRSNLSPKDRILLCVQSDVEEMKNGKKTLSQTDIDALTKSWKPKNNLEVREYNKYYYIWNVVRNIIIDMQTTYLNTIIAIKEAQTLVMIGDHQNDKYIQEKIDSVLSSEDREKVHILITKETGIEYNRLIHKETLLGLQKDIVEDLTILFPDVATEPEYLEQEMFLYEVLNEKDSLDEADIKKITEKIHGSIHFDYINLVIGHNINLTPSIFEDYFGSMPHMYFVKSLAKRLSITYTDDEDLKKKICNIIQKEVLLKEEITLCLRNGLLTEQYVPLCKSNDHSTCNGKDTKHPHCVLIETYVQKRRLIINALDEYIKNKKLTISTKERKLFSIVRKYSLVSGNGLYDLDDAESYSKDYMNGYGVLVPFVQLLVLINKKDIEKQYSYLLGYRDFLKKTTELLEVNIEFVYQKFFEDIDQEISILNQQIQMLYEKYTECLYTRSNSNCFPIEFFCEGFLYKLDDIKPEKNKSILLGIERVNKEWGCKIIDTYTNTDIG